MRKKLLIIIPAYNEAGTIGQLLDKLEEPEVADIADVLIMNDASVDVTPFIARNRGHNVVTHVFNLGYGSGLQVGYKYAIRRGYEYVIQMDADGQHDASNILKLYSELTTPDENGRCPDIVVGSRFMEGAGSFPISFVKQFAISMFRGIIRITTGQKITDPTSGLQGLNKRTVWYYSKYKHFDDKYPDANMLTQMILLGYYVKEIPAVMHDRSGGVSMHSGLLKQGIYMVRMVFSIIAVLLRVSSYGMDRESVNEYERIEEINITKNRQTV